MKITINSETVPKYTRETSGGRDYVVTKMMPIEGDSVMNQLYYPAPVVTNSFGQLDKLPAPVGHPVFNGEAVSALDPQGAAPFSIGAFIRNPVLNRKEVYAELAIDVDVAKQSDKGREVLNRIQSGRRLGVSTGLNGKIDQTVGRFNGQDYSGTLTEIRFDHVALLLDEAPAGENTFTLNRKSGGRAMRTVEIDTEALSLEDHAILQNASKFPKDIVKALTEKTTVKEASSIVTNAGQRVVDDPQLYDQFVANRDHLSDWLVTKADKRAEKVAFVIENSEMQEQHIEGMSDDALDTLVSSIKPKNAHISAFNSGGKAVELDLSALEA